MRVCLFKQAIGGEGRKAALCCPTKRQPVPVRVRGSDSNSHAVISVPFYGSLCYGGSNGRGDTKREQLTSSRCQVGYAAKLLCEAAAAAERSTLLIYGLVEFKLSDNLWLNSLETYFSNAPETRGAYTFSKGVQHGVV